MEKRIIIAHAGKSESELKKMKKLTEVKFPGAVVVNLNYSELPRSETNNIADDVEAVVISGYGRLITENGVATIAAARKKNLPVYFVVLLNNDGLDEQEARIWAYNHTNSSVFEQPAIAELQPTDESYTELYGKRVIILPTYAM